MEQGNSFKINYNRLSNLMFKAKGLVKKQMLKSNFLR